MRNNLRLSTYILILIIFSFINDNQIFGQEKVSILAGTEIPETLLNIGIQFRLDQTVLGGSIGFIGAYGTIPLSVDLYYHFGGSSKFSDMRPWYGNVGLDYLFLGTFEIEAKTLIYNLRIGRDFNISHKFGLEIDAGAFYSPIKLLFDSYVTPNLGIRVFYKII